VSYVQWTFGCGVVVADALDEPAGKPLQYHYMMLVSNLTVNRDGKGQRMKGREDRERESQGGREGGRGRGREERAGREGREEEGKERGREGGKDWGEGD